MTRAEIDGPGAVREGEELEPDRLLAYLAESLPDFEGPIEVRQFRKGHSNLTYLLRGKSQELVLRRAPPGVKIKTAHDMAREFRILAGLSRVYLRVPRPLVQCEDSAVLGSSFYIMERVRGLILRSRREVEALGLGPETMRRIADRLVENLVEIHGLDPDEAGLAELGRPSGYVSRQVSGWSERYQKSRTDEIPAMDRLSAWLAENQPPESDACLIHNDYKYDNLVLDPQDPTRIVAVLDWEMATIGDPLMDLGTSLGYWVDADDAAALRSLELGLVGVPGNATRREVVARYAALSGRDVSNMLFYYVYALFKICGIAQQIYFRYKQGLSRDSRFAGMIQAVRILSATGETAIEKGRIDKLS